MSKDIFENLITDITAQVIAQVQQQINPLVVEAVNGRLESLVNNNHITNTIEDSINRAVVQYKPDMSAIDKNIQTMLGQWGSSISSDLNIRVDKLLDEKIKTIDLTALILGQISSKLDPANTTYPFKENSIDIKSINTANLRISGDQVSAGVIKNFGSTGIDDQASTCQVTILDQGTVFENTLYAPKLVVKGGATIDGDLEILGQIVDNTAYRKLVADVAVNTQSAITDEVLIRHQDIVFEKIRTDGIDLNKVTFNGRLLVDGDRLVGAVNSQLRTVGVLQDLQTSGDTLLSDTLYVAGKRVGVNTMDPKSALSIWDEEIEVSVGKNQKGIGRISVERENSLVLGSNGHDNITLKSDGTTVIPKLQLNNMLITSSPTPPSDNAARGTVVFNENPSLGGPLGWVSLGDARWANFGIID
jgi:hypothetical protein